jgi:hypothetical protein
MNSSIFKPKQLVENSVEKSAGPAPLPACSHPPKTRLPLRCGQLLSCFQSFTDGSGAIELEMALFWQGPKSTANGASFAQR